MSVRSIMALLVLLLLPGTYVGLWCYPSTRWVPVDAQSIEPCIQGGRQGIHFFLCVFLLLNAVDDAADCALFFPWNAFWNVCSLVSQPGGNHGGEPTAYQLESIEGIQGWIVDKTVEQAPWPGEESLPLEECRMDPRAGQPMPRLKRFREC